MKYVAYSTALHIFHNYRMCVYTVHCMCVSLYARCVRLCTVHCVREVEKKRAPTDECLRRLFAIVGFKRGCFILSIWVGTWRFHTMWDAVSDFFLQLFVCTFFISIPFGVARSACIRRSAVHRWILTLLFAAYYLRAYAHLWVMLLFVVVV